MKRLVIGGLAALAAALGLTGNAHADSGNSEFLAAMHGREPGTTRMTVVTVPGGDTERVLLANVACAAYDKSGGMAAIAAVKAAGRTSPSARRTRC